MNSPKPKNASVAEKLLSSYEKSFLNGAKRKSAADLIEGDYVVKGALKRALGLTLCATTANGTDIELSALDLIAVGAVANSIRNPKMDDLKTMAAVMGEMKDANVEVTVSTVDRTLEDMALVDHTDDGKAGGSK